MFAALRGVGLLLCQRYKLLWEREMRSNRRDVSPTELQEQSANPRALAEAADLLMIDALLEKNLLPDWLVRRGIRRLLAQRIREETSPSPAEEKERLLAYVADLKRRPVAEETSAANGQHYEVPTAFYRLCLGRRLKYSGCLYPTGKETLDQAEEVMLRLYVERAQIADGQQILELGCGWGSFSLYLAERFPQAQITGVSNSRTQKEFIDAEAARRGLSNLRILTRDMNQFDPGTARFDRVVSIEMFEHMKNYQLLLSRISLWLKPGGRLFVHIFTHHRFAYHFVARDKTVGWRAISSPEAICPPLTSSDIFRMI